MEIVIASLRTADRKIAEHKPDCVISIGKPGGLQHCMDPGGGVTFVRLSMWDTMPTRRRRPLPSSETVWLGVHAVRSVRPSKLLVHCRAGRSRSTAMALVCLVAMGASEEDAIEQLLVAAPKSDPNGWILCLGDVYLDSHLFKAATDAGIVKW